MTRASIITIGDELLIGQVIDTNSAWIAQQLNRIGINVTRRIAVGDVWGEIWRALDEESKTADIILLTGGLGPTADDITKPLLCQYFNGKMIVDEPTLKHLKNLFENILQRPLLERNLKQAEVPDVCTVIPNKNGTAPGMWFQKNQTIFISMPGVPSEMKSMMQDQVIPALLQHFKPGYIVHKTLLTAGIGESFLAELIKDFETSLPPSIKLAYLPNYGLVRLRLSASGVEKEMLEKEISSRFTQLQILVTDYLVSNEDELMEEVVGKLLIKEKKTVSTAESCTGGYIAHLLTTKAGASAYFNGSVISYSNQIKQDLLAVNPETLVQKGAVSEEVVIQMAKGALTHLKTNFTIAVSGIMGPDGGTPEKPVGTIWVAVGNAEKIIAQKFHFRFNREKNIQLTAINALNMLRQFILATKN